MKRPWLPVMIALVLAGCTEAPRRAEMIRAQFVDPGPESEERWARRELASAREAMRAAEEEIAIQDDRFPWMRDHTKASVLLEQAEQDLIRARAAALRARADAEVRSREAMDRAEAALGDARWRMLIAPASSGRGGGARGSDLDAAEARIEEARALHADGRYDEAEALLDGIHETIAALRSGGRGSSDGLY